MLYGQTRWNTSPRTMKTWPGQKIFDALYGSVLAPMADLIERLRFGSILVLVLVLSYRFADLVWGAFAYPFYLGENFGALGHTLDEVAIASKLFGALMTFVGIGIGGAAILKIGRMPCLVAGAVLAAATNLLFADLAQGGAATNAFMSATHLYGLFGFMQPLADFLGLNVTANHALSRLMLVIAAENLAVGFASEAIVVYLSSIVNKRYAAVQYALLASLGFLLGSLGRGALGELIEERGFAYVFYLTAALGLVAVVASALEWIRQIRHGAPDQPKQAPAKIAAGPAD
jgi:PAT family beta-lactamase induction signal transducer AmpG